ncbi:hypothetical protein GOV03_04180, partial [Candidatus Woesearchaeota archaeon]|nr:hypothetical protein [Candidatus Woesearchaeota archaeon]
EINASYQAGTYQLEGNFTNLDSGEYVYTAYGMDQAGNLNETEERTFQVNAVPTQGTPVLNSSSGTNSSSENLTVHNISTTDDGDIVTNIIDWREDEDSLAVLNLPFETNTSTSTSTKDYSSNSNDGDVSGATFNSTGGYNGFGAYQFDGDDDGISVTDSASLSLTDEVTIEAWFKLSQKNITNLSMGQIFSCALTDNGSVYCWGYNGHGQIGQGYAGVPIPLPKKVLGLSNVVQMDTGYYHSCAIVQNGSVLCWGYNAYGNLWDTTTATRTTPVKVTELYNISKITCSYHSTCAILQNGTAMCGGYNGYGQLGVGDTATKTDPTPVLNVSNVTEITQSSMYHNCFLQENGTVKCTGRNNYGQLGDGSQIQKTSPVDADIINVTSLVVGVYHTCAIQQNTSVMCWGYNSHGELGDGTATLKTSPITTNITDVSSIDASHYHTCAILQNGTAMCWGYNDVMQIGDNTTTSRTRPVPAKSINNATVISASNKQTCGVNMEGSIICWGDNTYGQLGYGTYGYTVTPLTVEGLINATGITKGGYSLTSCTLLQNGTAMCWGQNSQGQCGDGSTETIKKHPGEVIGLTNVTDISNGQRHTCAVQENGSVMCWGYGASGRLGRGSTTSSYIPVAANIIDAVEVSAAISHSCALQENGSVMCWGVNSNGQLGDGTNTQRESPVVVINVDNATDIDTGYHTSYAVLLNGTAMSWGLNSYGQLGDGTTTNNNSGTVVSGLINATQISGGTYSACALLQNGTVMCWGLNTNGQCGDSTLTSPRTTPVSVSGVINATQINVGVYHACALLQNGTVMCWGSNNNGQLGDGTTSRRSTPITVKGVSNAVTIRSGLYFTCAILQNGTESCWGHNSLGQLGNTRIGTAQYSSPVILEAISKDRRVYGLFTDFGYNPTTILGTINDQTLMTSVNRNEWSHIALSKNSTDISMYLNGQLQSSQSYTTDINSGGGDIQIGKISGALDNIRIWRKGLSAEQVLALYQNITDIMHFSMTSVNETWSATITPVDIYDEGITALSNNVTIIPSPPLLDSPNDGEDITDRTPTFIWNNSEDTTNALYEIMVDNDPAFASPEIQVGNVSETTDQTNYTSSTELDVDVVYYWKVRANDSDLFSEWSTTFNFTVESYIAVSMVVDNVSFGTMLNEDTNDTTNNRPPPFVVENSGNIFVNITVTGTQLFTQGGFPSNYFQFKIDENETSSYNTTDSTTTWTNINSSSTVDDVVNLNWRDTNDAFETDLNITVPIDEGDGAKSSTLTFAAT